jgi:hypothetical protein
MYRNSLPMILAAGLFCRLWASEPTLAGLHLATQYDAMDVEHRWLPGHPVDWRTGAPVSDKIGKTHCSAFAAAICERLGIYLLRPPEHTQKNLANAQFHWLAEAGAQQDWAPVDSPFRAQQLANTGQVVLGVFLNPNPAKSGHIALVLPSSKSDSDIQTEGPQVIQAGGTNYASTSLKTGFRQHRGAWLSADDHQIRFYAHPVPAGQ